MNYAKMFTLRSDGRYMGHVYKDGRRRCVYDRDPERLYHRIEAMKKAAPPRITLEEAAERWYERHREQVGANTADTYKAPIRRIGDAFRDEAVGEVTAAEINAFLADLGKNKGFSRRSVQLHRDILNMVLNDAIVSGDCAVNPCAAASMPKGLSSKKRELPDDEAIEAVKNSKNAPFALFALFCLFTGMRRGEVLALTFEDIDAKNGKIRVNKAIEYIGNDPHVKKPKTAAGIREVPLLDPLAEILPKGKGLIFAREDGGPLTKTQYRKRWKKYCDAIGFEITAHQLRHGYATILFEAGIADKDAQELLGHSTIAVTRDIYTHIRSARRDETAAKLNAYVVNSVVK